MSTARLPRTLTNLRSQFSARVGLTLLLLVLNLLVFGYQATLPAAQLEQFILRWSATPMEIMEWTDLPPTVPFPIAGTMLSALFLHSSPLHFVLNMLLLVVFGMAVERQSGPVAMLVIYLVGGLVGSFVQIVANPHTLVSLIGASGAIAALIGAMLLLPRAPYQTYVVVSWGVWQLGTLIDQLVNPHWISGGLAIWSHVGGLATGMVFGWLMRRCTPPIGESPSHLTAPREF